MPATRVTVNASFLDFFQISIAVSGTAVAPYYFTACSALAFSMLVLIG